jgi:thiamine biosynthesis protein ThiI
MSCLYIIRYDEIGLKGQNRSTFEKCLGKNIQNQVRRPHKVQIVRIEGRILAEIQPEGEQELTEALKRTPGISSFSKAVPIECDIDVIKKAALEEFRKNWDGCSPIQFRVSTKRSDKNFPIKSNDLNTQVGAFIFEHCPQELLRVNLKHPELEIGIEIHKKRAMVHSAKERGVGGLPVGTAGDVLCLLSGGIDSPVAAYQMIRRGCRVHHVFFENRVFLGRAAYEKVLRLAKKISVYQGFSMLYVVPFTDIQVAIRDNCRDRNRVILYRRYMYRIAERLMEQKKCLGLVNGECLGQVASQTLENMRAVNDVVQAPVYRPLISMDKNEVVNIAKNIDTFDISKEDAPDCCSVFMPSRPVTKAKSELLVEDETKLDSEALIQKAIDEMEVIRV